MRVYSNIFDVHDGSFCSDRPLPTKLTIKTATQIATPSDQPLSSLCDLTAAPITVETCKSLACLGLCISVARNLVRDGLQRSGLLYRGKAYIPSSMMLCKATVKLLLCAFITRNIKS